MPSFSSIVSIVKEDTVFLGVSWRGQSWMYKQESKLNLGIHCVDLGWLGDIHYVDLGRLGLLLLLFYLKPQDSNAINVLMKILSCKSHLLL